MGNIIPKKRIAVLLSAYNGAQYIEEQIQSILAQEDVDVDLVIRDDGSTDNTLEILRAIKKKHNNIEIIEGENIGLVRSFFYLLHYGYEKGYEFFSFSDQDDYWKPEKIKTALDFLSKEKKDIPLMYASCSEIADSDLNGQEITTQQKRRKITFYNTAIQNICIGHSQVINRQRAGLILSKTKKSKNIYSQDLWFTNVAAVTGKVIFDNTPHALYRQHSDNQLGYGKSKLDWIRDHIARLQKNECRQIALQLREFIAEYKEYLSNDEKNEMVEFFRLQSTLSRRFRYIMHMKLYRQKGHETAMLKMLYLLGKYNI